MNNSFLKLSLLGVLSSALGACAAFTPRESSNESIIAQKSLAPRILIIGHRGACGYRPEHTLASYGLAIEMGADFIEPDLVSTKDGVLIARHENDISETTNVAERFPKRKKTKKVDGKEITGWFTEDFTLKEIRTLRAKERLPTRDHSFDGKFSLVTFQEIIDFVKQREKETRRTIGIYPELKHSRYFSSIGLPLEEKFVKILNKNGYTEESSPIFVQSFEVANLKKLKKMTRVRLLQLFDEPAEQPFDFVVKGDHRTYADLALPVNLDEIATYASAIGPHKSMIVSVPNLVAEAHKRNLLVHPYTFRSDSPFLAPKYNGDPTEEYLKFFNLGVDGVFSDFAEAAVKARAQYESSSQQKDLHQ